MSKARPNWKDFPVEIIERVKILAGLSYNEKACSNFIDGKDSDSQLPGKSSGGFDYSSSSEGSTFWSKVIGQRDFDVFFTRYPKYVPFTRKPTNVNVGDKFIVVGDDSSYFPKGCTVELRHNDGTINPSFTNPEHGSHYMSWKNVAPLNTASNPVEKGYTSIPTDLQIGDTFIICSNLDHDGDEVDLNDYNCKIGDIITLNELDGSWNPEFTFPNGDTHYFDFGCLKEHTKVDRRTIFKSYFTEKPKEGAFKEGDKFEIITDIYEGKRRESFFSARINVGDIITLSSDDRTDNPWFTRADGETISCYWSFLKPVNSTNLQTLNIQTNGKVHQDSNISTCSIVSRISQPISSGFVARGTTLQRPKRKIQLGS